LKQKLTRELVALRVARELKDGMYVNLGFGLPTLVSNFMPPTADIVLHSEQGILGYGPIIREPERWDIDLVNASAQPVELAPGSCFFDFAASFAMIRGHHLDVTVLGAYQVSEKGDLANWRLKDQQTGGIGGGMELAIGAKRVIVAMEHCSKDGKPKIVHVCEYPLTASACVDLIVTDLAVIEVTPDGLVMREIAPGWTPGEIQNMTEPKLVVADDLEEMQF